jgi:hypothetical protein
VFDFVDSGYLLEMGVLQQETIYKPAMNSDVNVLVDCRGYQESAVVAIVRRQVSPAAAERDPQWRTRDDHFGKANMESRSGLSSAPIRQLAS